jgi:hypothetical protein
MWLLGALTFGIRVKIYLSPPSGVEVNNAAANMLTPSNVFMT